MYQLTKQERNQVKQAKEADNNRTGAYLLNDSLSTWSITVDQSAQRVLLIKIFNTAFDA